MIETAGKPFPAGVVQDLNGNPVANARVYFTSSPVALPDIAALTDGAGRFMLTAPQPGQYTIACAADGWETKSVAVNAEPSYYRVPRPSAAIESYRFHGSIQERRRDSRGGSPFIGVSTTTPATDLKSNLRLTSPV